jgi:hypothetical protein
MPMNCTTPNLKADFGSRFRILIMQSRGVKLFYGKGNYQLIKKQTLLLKKHGFLSIDNLWMADKKMNKTCQM